MRVAQAPVRSPAPSRTPAFTCGEEFRHYTGSRCSCASAVVGDSGLLELAAEAYAPAGWLQLGGWGLSFGESQGRLGTYLIYPR